MSTHEVLNQCPPLEGHDVYGLDTALQEAVAREGAGWADDDLHALGELAGSPEAIEWGRLANENPPILHTHDRFGHRLDRVTYHPAYHQLMETAVGHGMHAAPWADDRPGAHTARAAKLIVWSSVDAGHTCPISMTYAVVASLHHAPDLADQWLPGLAAPIYDPSYVPADRKEGLTAGMAMTEKQGGSDVRANTTVAEPDGDGAYRLTGHKWFVSAPMSDVFLALGVAPEGLSCFLVPRWLPDGTRNAIFIQRLKDKLGDRSNASSEVEFDGAWALGVGDEGRGVRTIIEMVNRTRLDCSLGAAAGMRHGLVQAIHHARHRSAFGRLLAEQPLMEQVLADLALESEAAAAAALRLGGAYDREPRDEREALFARIATPVVKYWNTKRAAAHAAEAMECLGGNGYVEESPMPRLFRQSTVNGIWEGSGNVICLDVLRAMAKAPRATEVFLDELRAAAGSDARYDTALESVEKAIAAGASEAGARRLVEAMAVVLQASLLLRHAPAFVAEGFIASRLPQPGAVFGTLPGDVDAKALVERALPA
jgi:putative acyl-CoA dehydrogenase